MTFRRDLVIDMMKALRLEWMSAREVSIALDCDRESAADWLRELQRHGIVESRRRQVKKGSKGCPPTEFRLSDAWGGTL